MVWALLLRKYTGSKSEPDPECKVPGTRSKNWISVLLIGSETQILRSPVHVICLGTS